MHPETRSLFNNGNTWCMKNQVKSHAYVQDKKMILAPKALQPNWDLYSRCHIKDGIWHATVKGAAIVQLCACSQKCNPGLDLKWMGNKTCRKSCELWRGWVTLKPPEFCVPHQPAVIFYTSIEAVWMVLKNSWLSQLEDAQVTTTDYYNFWTSASR